MNVIMAVLYVSVLFSSGYLAGTLSREAEIKKIKNKVSIYKKLLVETIKSRD